MCSRDYIRSNAPLGERANVESRVAGGTQLVVGNFWHDTAAKELKHHFACQLARFARWLCSLLANHAIFPYALLLFGFELKEHGRELVCFCRWHCKAIRKHKAKYKVSVFSGSLSDEPFLGADSTARSC